jgi:hypothetical protein
VAEVRRFFVTVLWPKARQLASVLHWSNWRRHHQAQAQVFHYKTRKALRHLQL